MRPLFSAAWGILGGLGFVASALAAPAPISVDDIPVPPERPAQVTNSTGPATLPTEVAVDPNPAPVRIGAKVVLLPFAALGDAAGRDWVGHALEDSLSAEVARIGDVTPVAIAAAGSDTQSAIDAAKAQGGDVVVFGSYQINDSQVRLSAQVIDVASGKAIAGLKASGEFTDLFSLEDQLGGELRRALRPPPPQTVHDQLASNQPVFGEQTPPLTADDVYGYPGYNPSIYDAYNRYYYDWSQFPSGGFGYGFGFGGLGGGGFIGGFTGGGGFGSGSGGHRGMGGGRGGGHRMGYNAPNPAPITPTPNAPQTAAVPVVKSAPVIPPPPMQLYSDAANRPQN